MPTLTDSAIVYEYKGMACLHLKKIVVRQLKGKMFVVFVRSVEIYLVKRAVQLRTFR